MAVTERRQLLPISNQKRQAVGHLPRQRSAFCSAAESPIPLALT